MIVMGHPISDEIEAVFLRWAAGATIRSGAFTSAEAREQILRLGIPSKILDRAADRLLQKARKSGRAIFVGGYWRVRAELER